MRSFGKILVRVRRGPRANRSGGWVSIAVAATVGVLALPAASAGAATFTVNTVSDVTIGTCDAAHCTLREAITDANGAAGADTIAFSIPGAPPHSIKPLTQLPTVTDPVTIDGTTEPDFTSSPVVEISGENAPVDTPGLLITAGSSTVRGLVINRFVHGVANFNSPDGEGIVLRTGGGNVVQGNYLGTDVTGTIDLGNHTGVNISSSANNTIGGTTPAARNVISGNNRFAVYFQNFSNTGNTVEGNYIGLAASGTAAVPNLAGVNFNTGDNNDVRNNVISSNSGGAVISIGGNSNRINDNLIGTDALGNPGFGNGTGIQLFSASSNVVEDNVISSSGQSGVLINSSQVAFPATDNVLEGNQITGNGSAGVVIGTVSGHDGNRIGGTDSGDGNVIAFNGGVGVAIATGNVGNSVLSNSIHSNGALGIDLESDGVTPNDLGDADSGANERQNFPVLTFAGASGGTTLVEGTLNSEPSQTYRLEFFSNAACDSSGGNGEGRTFLGSVSVTTNGSGNASFSQTLAGASSPGEVATATATDPNGSTSEFSACRAIVRLVPGKVSARGTVTGSADPNTRFSAANDCIGSQSTRPFIVEWLTRRFTKTTVTSSRCFDDPAVTPSPAVPSGFDTQTGRANGVLENSQPATIEWTFVEGGAGASPLDRVEFTIRNGGGAVLLSVSRQLPRPLGGTPGGVWTFAAPPPSA